MSDDDFFQIEQAAQYALNEFKDACIETDEDFEERAADLVFNSEHKDD